MEHLTTHVLDLPTLFGTTSRAPEEAVAQVLLLKIRGFLSVLPECMLKITPTGLIILSPVFTYQCSQFWFVLTAHSSHFKNIKFSKFGSCSTGQIINVYKISACYNVSIKSYSIISKNIKGPGANEQCAIMYFFNIFLFCLLCAFILSLFGNVVIDILGVIQEKVCQYFFKLPYDIINWLKICI